MKMVCDNAETCKENGVDCPHIGEHKKTNDCTWRCEFNKGICVDVNQTKTIGKGWCVVTKKECRYSDGHGSDGKVKCSCDGECPEGVEK